MPEFMGRVVASVTLFVALVMLPLAASAEPATLKKLRSAGEAKFGIALGAPWAFEDADGNLAGYEVDIANRLAADMGVEASFVVVPFAELVNGLKGGKFDLVVSAFSITPERAAEVAFTDRYRLTGVELVAKTAKADGGLDAFNSDKVKVGVVTGTIAAAAVQERLPQAEIVEMKEIQPLVKALLDGKVDAIAEAAPYPDLLVAAEAGKLDLVGDPLSLAVDAVAVPYGDPDFVIYLNALIEAQKADGLYDVLNRHWLQTTDWTVRMKNKITSTSGE